jgi:hypothetical protein
VLQAQLEPLARNGLLALGFNGSAVVAQLHAREFEAVRRWIRSRSGPGSRSHVTEIGR